LIGGVLYQQSTIAPFLFGAAVLLVGCLLVVVLVPVPAQGDTAYGAGQGRRPLRHAIRDQLSAFQDLHAARRQGDRSLLALLGAIFCLFLAYSALTVFFTSFALDSLRVARGQESQLLTFFALAIVVFALPTGLISARIGRRRATLGGVLTLAAALAMIGLATDLAMIRGLLILAGAGWALITVNALPMVLDSAPPDRLEQIGIYTGIYFLATQSAEVIGPVLVGGFLDLTGRNYRFIFAYTLI